MYDSEIVVLAVNLTLVVGSTILTGALSTRIAIDKHEFLISLKLKMGLWMK